MKIRDLEIEGFGEWPGLLLQGFSAELNVVYGPQRPMLAAIREFVQSVLYGFPTAIWRGAAAGKAHGWIRATDGHETYTLDRAIEGTPGGQLTIRDDRGRLHECLNTLVGNVDQATYAHVFNPGCHGSLRLQHLLACAQRFGILSDTASGERAPSRSKTRMHFQEQTEEIDRQIAAVESQIADLTSRAAAPSPASARQPGLERRYRRLRSVLRDLAQLRGQLRAEIAACSTPCVASRAQADATLVQHEPDPWQCYQELAAKVERLRSGTPQAIHSIEESLRQLGTELQLHQGAVRRYVLQHELEQVRRTYRELSRLLAGLADRRRAMSGEEVPVGEANELVRAEGNLRQLALLEERTRLVGRRAQLQTELGRTLADDERKSAARLGDTPCLAAASTWLSRLSSGDQRQIRILDAERGASLVWVENRLGESHTADVLTIETQDLVYLSLCLALVDAFAQRGVHLPLLVDETMWRAVNVVDRDGCPAEKLLAEFAAKGRQVLCFTADQAVARRLALRGATLHGLPDLPPARLAPPPAASSPSPRSWYRWETGWSAEEFPGELQDRNYSGSRAA